MHGSENAKRAHRGEDNWCGCGLQMQLKLKDNEAIALGPAILEHPKTFGS